MSAIRAEKRMREYVAALGSPDKAVAERAEYLLIRHYGSRPVDLLIEACASADESTRFRAAWILGKTRDSRAFETLLRLTDDPMPSVRYDATLALGYLGNPRAIEPLIRIMCALDPVDTVDSAACEALAMLGTQIIPTFTVLAKDDDPAILLRIAWTLRTLKSEAGSELAKSLLSHSNPDVRTAAAEALEEIEAR